MITEALVFLGIGVYLIGFYFCFKQFNRCSEQLLCLFWPLFLIAGCILELYDDIKEWKERKWPK